MWHSGWAVPEKKIEIKKKKQSLIKEFYIVNKQLTFSAYNFGAFGVFWPIYQNQFWYRESLVHVFH